MPPAGILRASLGLLLGVASACLPAYQVREGAGGTTTGGGGSGGAGASCGDCLGGDCVDGVCQPVIFAAGQKGGTAIAVDANRVVWTGTAPGPLLSCPPTGCVGKPEELVVPEAAAARRLALGAKHLFWTVDATPGALRRCDLPLCTGVATMHAAPEPYVGLAVRESFVYFGVAGQTSGTLMRCEVAGCGAPPQGSLVYDEQTNPLSIAVTGGTVYWVERDGSLRRCSTNDDCTDYVDEVTPSGAVAVAVDETQVYWTAWSGGAGGVFACSIGGCGSGPKVLATAGSAPGALVVAGARVYWLEPGTAADGRVMRVGVDGSSPTLVASGQPGPAALAAGADAVYWLNAGVGALPGDVRRVAR